MFDLFSFYRSKQWVDLLKQLKIERANEDGDILCEYCGKPIVKAYDCIGHHKEELTEDNVNDFNISLNPNNISFVHHKCHNYIHNKLGYSERKIYIVYGAPLAGKSEWVKANKNEGDLIVNIDDIWEMISGCQRYVKPNKLKAVAFKTRDVLLDSVRYRLGRWRNAYVVGGYALQSERERICKELGAEEILIESTKAECLARLEQNETIEDKEQFEKFIDEWFERFRPSPVG
jgi:predicted kinase